MIPDYQSLMRPVLEQARNGEVQISDVVDQLADQYQLSAEERDEPLPSGRQTRFANRVHWAKGYLKQAGLVEATRRGYFSITDRGIAALGDTDIEINNTYLERFEEFRTFRGLLSSGNTHKHTAKPKDDDATPEENLREAHRQITAALSADLLDRVRNSSPGFFEKLVIDLLSAMNYGGTSADSSRTLGKTGDDGVDGVIDQDELGVDQIYVQAKRYAEHVVVGPDKIREFYGALDLQKARKGVFFTTSTFTEKAKKTAQSLGRRIVLVDGIQLGRLMVTHSVGCRERVTLPLMEVDEDFFDG